MQKTLGIDKIEGFWLISVKIKNYDASKGEFI